MSNFEIVTTYKDEDAAWLRERGYPHPPVKPGNEMPTTADMKWALEAFDNLVFDYPSGEGELSGKDEETGWWFSIRDFDWDEANTIPGDFFAIRGSTVILAVLIKLCERCGQLYVYPDSGDPAIVLDASLDAEEVVALYTEASEDIDSWQYFFEQMYGG